MLSGDLEVVKLIKPLETIQRESEQVSRGADVAGRVETSLE